MKSIRMNVKTVLTSLFFIFSFSIFASDLPDPEALAKQYLKDLCTLNEQDFVLKYMLTQKDAEFIINETTATYKKLDLEIHGTITDTLAIRSKVQKIVVRSYRKFKEWQHKNNIDSSKIDYNFCEFELEKKRDVPFYITDNVKIYFTVDTLNYLLVCEDFGFIKNKWITGEIDEIKSLDKSFNVIDNYSEDDETAAVYNENDYSTTKKQLKIQKKVDAHHRKIDVLNIKKYK